jgi:hypothetical protein
VVCGCLLQLLESQEMGVKDPPPQQPAVPLRQALQQFEAVHGRAAAAGAAQWEGPRKTCVPVIMKHPTDAGSTQCHGGPDERCQ